MTDESAGDAVGNLGLNVDRELRKTEPDFVVYVPRSADGSTHDTGNEHFLVFDGPDGSLMAVWTQSTREGEPDQRIVFARSADEGRTWTAPEVIAGAVPPEVGRMASWAFPLVSRSGRIYVLYSRHTGANDVFRHTTGLMACICSGDAGRTWSEEAIIPMPRSRWDHPDASMPANWIVWQRPARVSEGKYFVGFTRWVSSAVRHAPPVDSWTAAESVVEFMRFENLDDDPGPADLEVGYFASNDQALRVGYPGHPEVSVVQEPSVVLLPDGRLFVIMRTATGSPYYSVSDDGGRRWRAPEVLRRTDGGPRLAHPLSPCPMYPLGTRAAQRAASQSSAGKFLLLYHGHDGHFEKWGPLDTTHHRRPICGALGEFRRGASQPVWFSREKFLMDNGGTPLGYGRGRSDLAMYASFTSRGGVDVLWYPERKFFLLGKRITVDWLADLAVPTEAEADPGPMTSYTPT